MKIIIYNLYQFLQNYICIYIEYIFYHQVQRALVNLSRKYILGKNIALIKCKINIQ